MESSLLKFSLEETQQIVAMIQEIINKIKIIKKRINHLEDQLERLCPSDRGDKSIDFDIDLDSIELLALSLAVDSELVRTDCSDDVVEHNPESDTMNSLCVTPSAEIVVKVLLTTDNNCNHSIKVTRKQHACVNRLTVLELFALMTSALLTGIGSQHKVWKPGLCSA